MFLRFIIVLTLCCFSFISQKGYAGCKPFPDDGDYCEDVQYLYDHKMIDGYDSGRFGFGDILSRREMMKMTLLSLKDKEKTEAEYKNEIYNKDADTVTCFPDVSKSDWAYEYICYSKKEGFVIGYPSGKFHPGEKITYDEASKIILKTLSGGKECWKSNTSDWWIHYVSYMNEIIKFDVIRSKKVEREFFAHMLRNAMEVIDGIKSCEPVKDNDFDDYIGIMKTTRPYNDIGKPIDEIRCNERNMNIRVKDRKICTRRFEKGELAIVYNDDGKIDFAVPYVPLFNEYFGSGNTCSIMPYDTDQYYTSEPLFQKDACNGMTLCGNRAKGCHILSVGMIDYYYNNERINGGEVNDYNKWLRDNGQSDGCGLILPANKKYMNLSNQGNQSILKTFEVRNSDYISQMQKKLNGNSKLQSYVKTRRPVLLQYKYKGPVDNNTHAIVLVGKDVSGNYIVQDPYFNRLSNGRATMFLTLQEAIENHKRERDTTDITFTKLIFYYGK